ncbi:MAG: TIGR02281 family clan AA aspartic protease [Pseudomonadota bacterium]
MSRVVVAALAAVSLFALPWAFAAVDRDVKVVGLFMDAAVLEIEGEQILLKAGGEHAGVQLVTADSRSATVRIGEDSWTLSLSEEISGRFRTPEKQEVRLGKDARGQYRVGGLINGSPVSFLVDTGATVVAMNLPTARGLGIDLTNADRRRAVTAGGVVESWEVVVDRIQVGSIAVNNVRTAVLNGDFPQDILLGMSFLNQVQMSEERGVMVLSTL